MRLFPAFPFLGVDEHPLDNGYPLGSQEHVLRSTQADPFGPHRDGPLGVARGVGVGPDPQAAHLVGPRKEGLGLAELR